MLFPFLLIALALTAGLVAGTIVLRYPRTARRTAAPALDTARKVGEGTATAKTQDEKLTGFKPSPRKRRRGSTVTLPANNLKFDRVEEPVGYEAAHAALEQLDSGAK